MTNDFTDYSPANIQLALTMFSLPGLAKKVTDAICNDIQLSTFDKHNIIEQIQDTRTKIRSWRLCFGAAILDEQLSTMPGRYADRRLELFGTALTITAISNRLLCAISPSYLDKVEFETERAARGVLGLREKAEVTNYSASFYLCQKAGIAEATIATKSEWDRYKEESMMPRAPFENWCRLIPRAIC